MPCYAVCFLDASQRLQKKLLLISKRTICLEMNKRVIILKKYRNILAIAKI